MGQMFENFLKMGAGTLIYVGIFTIMEDGSNDNNIGQGSWPGDTSDLWWVETLETVMLTYWTDSVICKTDELGWADPGDY